MKLYIQQKVFSIGDKYNIFDEQNRPIYQVEGEVFTLGAKIHLYDLNRRELYYIEQKVLSFLPVYRVFQGSQLRAEIQKEFTFFTNDLTINSSMGQYVLTGDFMAMSFSITHNGKLVGSIHKEWFTFGDCYELNIADGADPAFFSAMVIAIDNCLHNGKD